MCRLPSTGRAATSPSPETRPGLLKTSSVNAALQIMYNLQTTTGAQHGMNTIVIRDVARGDVITCQNCAFAKQPAITYGTDAGAVEWTFNAGSISFLLGM